MNNTSIEENYCSYGISELLKKKGFDEKTLSYYEDNVLCHGDWFEWNKSPLGHIAAPTHQMALKWLREVHGLIITVYYDIFPAPETTSYVVGYSFNIQVKDTRYCKICKYPYNSFEDATAAAMEYCLEYII